MVARIEKLTQACRRYPRVTWIAAAVAAAFSCGSYAQIRTDGSVGPAAQNLVRIGTTYTIPQTLGRIAGSNLFHSFDTFSIATGQTANFTTATAGLANVISRVTGGPSTINGRLRLTPVSGAPNFFFINPAGVTFGNGASIDVPGAFHVSTANYIKFPDGNFHADTSTPSTFSSVAPEAFGFLGATRATLAVNSGANLAQAATKPLSLIAGDVSVNRGSVSTSSGELRVVAVGPRTVEVPLTGAIPEVSGNLSVVNGGEIFSASGSALDSGSIMLSGGNVTIDGMFDFNTGVLSQTGGAGNAGNVVVSASGELVIKRGGFVASQTLSTGDAAPVSVRGNSIVLDTGAIYSDIAGPGNSGRIVVAAAGDLSVGNGGAIFSRVRSTGNAGAVDVSAGRDILIAGGSQVSAETRTTGAGAAVSVHAGRDMKLEGGGQIYSAASSSGNAGAVKASAGGDIVLNGGLIYSDAYSSGNAGKIEVIATGRISVIDGGQISSDTLFSGNAASIKIDADSVMLDFGRVYSDTYGSGRAGNIEVAARSELSVINASEISSTTYFSTGASGSISVDAGRINIDARGSSGSAGVLTRTEDSGNAGAIEVRSTGSLEIAGGGGIVSGTRSLGNAGQVSVTAGSIEIDSGGSPFATGIVSQANSGSSGSAGDVKVVATGKLSLTNGGGISASTFSAGNAGSVTVAAADILIDGRGNVDLGTGILSRAETGSTGTGGRIKVTATGDLTVANGGLISNSTLGRGHAGPITVNARNLLIDGADNTANVTGILSESKIGAAGNAGSIEVSVAEHLSIVNAGLLSSSLLFFSTGTGGDITVKADTIEIDGRGSAMPTGILSSAGTHSTGSAGSIDISARTSLSIFDGGAISASTFLAGGTGATTRRAGDVTIRAGQLFLDGRGNETIPTGIFTQSNFGAGSTGNIDIDVSGKLSIVDRAFISSGTFGSGDAGFIKVRAGSIDIDGRGVRTGIFGLADEGSSGRGGEIDVVAVNDLTLANRGQISSDTSGSGSAGSVKVSASDIKIDGRGALAAISSDALFDSQGSAGSVDVSASKTLVLINGGAISSDTFAIGNAGNVRVSAGDLAIDGEGRFARISSDALFGSAGNSGSVIVTAAGALSVAHGGSISSNTFAAGNAGTVKVGASSISIDGKGLFAGISSDALQGAGNAGNVEVVSAGMLSVINGGLISSDTASSGAAGSVNVRAASIVVDGMGLQTSISSDATPFSSGRAGNVEISVTGPLTIANGGFVSSSTFASGNAGSVKVGAASILLDGQGNRDGTGISSQANAGAGHAGSVDVSAGNLSLFSGGSITSDTANAGAAGSVKVSAGAVRVDGAGSTINASASRGSSGQTGSVSVTATESIKLSNGGNISISNDATVPDPSKLTPTTLTVSAPDIFLKDAQITAASSGNVAASDVQVIFTNQLFLDPSSITTSANLGDGGSIRIQGGNVITLENSQITTSVLGLTGNGGDINISAQTLFLLTGFIQANTAAANASGGAVNIDVQHLVASGNSLLLGGDVARVFQPGMFGFNVIQAAAPTGVSGVVQTSTPPLDVTGSLSGLIAQVIDPGGLARNPCQVSGGSSLTQAGRGGLAPSARGLLGAAPIAAPVTLGSLPSQNGSTQTASVTSACH